MDRLTKKERSVLMSRVRVKDTDIEKILIGIVRPFWKRERYRRNVKNLPGKPDVVFSRLKVVIFADGDFWHGKNFKKWKAEIPAFWQKKIAGNIKRDCLQNRELRKAGYCVHRFYGSKIKQSPEYVKRIIGKSLR